MMDKFSDPEPQIEVSLLGQSGTEEWLENQNAEGNKQQQTSRPTSTEMKERTRRQTK